jgi:transposase
VNTVSAGYRGEAKTDAKDAFVIADISRLCGDFTAVQVPAELVAELGLLTGHRADLVADRIRLLSRLRELLTGVFPALERAFDYSRHRGALVLLTGYQSPDSLRRRGLGRLTAWLGKRGVRRADQVAAKALAAAAAQHSTLPGQAVAGQIIADLAGQLLAVDDRLARVDKQIQAVFGQHPQADVITSMPGIGTLLAAEFVVAAGDLSGYPDAGRLASAAGLVPVPRDSGRRTGNLHRPRRYSRRLRRVFYLSLPRPASSATGPAATTTSRSAAKDSATSKPSSRSPEDESTSSGRSCARTDTSPLRPRPPRRQPSPLDKRH